MVPIPNLPSVEDRGRELVELFRTQSHFQEMLGPVFREMRIARSASPSGVLPDPLVQWKLREAFRGLRKHVPVPNGGCSPLTYWGTAVRKEAARIIAEEIDKWL